jgi:hypothetical protein
VATYATEFFLSGKIGEHDKVAAAKALPNGFVHVERKSQSPVTIAPLSVPRITTRLVEEVLSDGTPTIIMLVPKASHYDWSARRLALQRESAVQTYSETFWALNDSDPRPFLDKSVAYNTEALRQHSKVVALTMICESSFRLRRAGAAPDLVVAIEYEYEFTQEALINARKRHPEATVYLNANPNGRPTSAAVGHGEFTGVEVHRLGDFMRRLHRA